MPKNNREGFFSSEVTPACAIGKSFILGAEVGFDTHDLVIISDVTLAYAILRGTDDKRNFRALSN